MLAGSFDNRSSTDGSSPAARASPVRLRAFSDAVPRAVFIGASTGGVDAICDVLASLARFTALPVIVVLHIQADYAPIVARQAARAASRPCVLAFDGALVRRDCIHLAPGGAHWRVTRAGAQLFLRRERGEVEGITPSVDVLFRSAAKALGTGALGVVLTGMGEDGLAGSVAIVNAGGSVVAQDKGSSVVWGMPGAVAEAGLASAVVPPAFLGPLLHRRFPKLAQDDP